MLIVNLQRKHKNEYLDVLSFFVIARFMVLLDSWLGLAWLGLAGFGLVCLGLTWHGMAWLGVVLLGLAWFCLAWLGFGWCWSCDTAVSVYTH